MSKNDRTEYKSVSDMLRGTAGDDEALTADEMDQLAARRKLVKELAVFRSSKGVTQSQLAESMGCSQSWVSKIENSDDDELTVGDLRKYLDGLGLEFRPGAVRKGATLVDEVKQLTFGIRARLMTMAELAHEGDGIGEHVARFFGQLFCNFNVFLRDAAEKLPRASGSNPCISIRFEELEMMEKEDPGESCTSTHKVPSNRASDVAALN